MKLLNCIKAKLLHYTWDLAYGQYDNSILKKGIDEKCVHIVSNPYKNKWFADPFIYEENERFMHLFVEEFDKKVKRGRIARIKIDKQTNSIIECRIILELPTHLSFPAIYRINGKIYVHPENYASGGSYIYEYDKEKDRLINPIVLVEQPLTDAVIRKVNTGYEMSATVGKDANGCKLSIFDANNFLGPYHLKHTVQYADNSARMAGYYIELGAKVFRPAQDCNGDYGRAVWLYDEKRVVGRLIPWGKYSGIHTFNSLGDTFVIDMKKYDYPLIYNYKKMIKK